jgi:hypothetical protein
MRRESGGICPEARWKPGRADEEAERPTETSLCKCTRNWQYIVLTAVLYLVGVQIVGYFENFSRTWRTSDDKSFVLPMQSAGFVAVLTAGYILSRAPGPLLTSHCFLLDLKVRVCTQSQIVGGWKAQQHHPHVGITHWYE